ncbi:MAG: penicillin-binding transpeptidase domain-containing protein, partial [Mucinivorans sp.]
VKQKISGDFWIPVANVNNIDPVNGYDVVTTINIEIQNIVQRALYQQLRDAHADWGTAIVMETQSGDIKAIANGTRLADGQVVEDYNYAVGMSLEPGSTFKLVGLMALLDDAKAPINMMVDTEGGRVQIGSAKVVDSRSGGYGTLTLQGVFEHSSNVGMAKCINHYYASNPSRFVDYVCKLGLNKELGLDIPGEARPLIKHPKLKNGWDGMTLTMMSYGYALRITPMQTLTIYNAVANGGMILRPRFVSELQQLGQTIKTYKNDTLISNICSPKTLELLQESMVGVVERGTAGLLKNKEYTVAAKTGTAQIAIGKHGYTAAGGGRHYLASLVGYFPAKNPRYTVLVAIKTFHRDGDGHPYYGGALSGPPFKTIINEIHKRENEFRTRTDNTIPIVGTPRSVLTALGGSSQELALLMREMKIKSALPVGGMSLIDSGVCCSFVPKSDSIATSVVGMSLREAVPMLERNGFKVLIHGKGRIVVQNYILDSLRGQKFVKLILE